MAGVLHRERLEDRRDEGEPAGGRSFRKGWPKKGEKKSKMKTEIYPLLDLERRAENQPLSTTVNDCKQ
jgi:hypothetical protein